MIAAMTLSGWAWCQPGSVIRFTNPSFEGTPQPGRLPEGWENCGPNHESPPDTQPGSFGVKRRAYDGGSYIGMVVRDYGTAESIGQKLSSLLKSGQCYKLKVFLSRSNVLRSPTLSSDIRDSSDFTVPAVLRIYAGDSLCHKFELLAETTPVDHFKWLEYELSFKPAGNYTHIVLAAEHKDNTKFYNGHILLDYLSDIEWVACDDDDGGG